ncbi:transcription initiation factor tfiid subunit taf5 [Cystoisospora suis]|uniref:Transcription initiation factor tfiid subunit taf5 n=1 Tax=Cystoisospora suis TaxID=483139 RepID=A0A2C6KM74_9APIC|nr:transcription initiation factor tfiid subunit taf5 [Cystoisospora suis]
MAGQQPPTPSAVPPGTNQTSSATPPFHPNQQDPSFLSYFSYNGASSHPLSEPATPGVMSSLSGGSTPLAGGGAHPRPLDVTTPQQGTGKTADSRGPSSSGENEGQRPVGDSHCGVTQPIHPHSGGPPNPNPSRSSIQSTPPITPPSYPFPAPHNMNPGGEVMYQQANGMIPPPPFSSSNSQNPSSYGYPPYLMTPGSAPPPYHQQSFPGGGGGVGTSSLPPTAAGPPGTDPGGLMVGTFPGGWAFHQAAGGETQPGYSVVSLATYEGIYSRFCIWVLSLFEDCREELMDVAFAVLMHMVKKLLSVDPNQARQLLSRFASLHYGKHQVLLRQLQQLQLIHPLQLRQVGYFAAEERHPVYMSERAYFVLRTWLVDTRCLLLEVMIQAAVRLLPPPPAAPHLRGIVYPGLSTVSSSATPSLPLPLSQATDPSRSGYFPAKQLWGLTPRPTAAPGAGGSGNSSAFNSSFGLLTGSGGGGALPPTLPGRVSSPPAGATAGLPVVPGGGAGKTKEVQGGVHSGWEGGGGGQGSKKEDGAEKKQEEPLPPVTWGLPKQFFREEVTVVGPGGERTKRVRILGGENVRETDLVDPEYLLPLPEPGRDAFFLYKRLHKQQAERRAPLSAASGQLPSIACITVLNASAEIGSCAVSPSTSKLVAVGGDGEIRLWNLQQQQIAKAHRERRRRKWILRAERCAQEGRLPPGSVEDLSTSSSDDSQGDVRSSSSSSGSEMDGDDVGGSRSRRKRGSRGDSRQLNERNGRVRKGRSSRAKNKKCVLDWGGEEEGEEEGTLRLVGCDGRVLSLAFGEVDDRILLSGGTDGIIRLWQPYSLSSWTSPATANLDDSDDDRGDLSVNGKKGGASGGSDNKDGDGDKGGGDSLGGGGEDDARGSDKGRQTGGGDKGPGEDRTRRKNDGEDLSSLSSSSFETLGRKSRIQGSNVATPLCLYRAALAAVWSLDIGPFGHYFASGSSDSCARLWCTSRSFPTRLLQHPAAATDVYTVKLHANSSLLLTSASDNVVRLFDLRTADVVRTFQPLLVPTGLGTAQREHGSDGVWRDILMPPGRPLTSGQRQRKAMLASRRESAGRVTCLANSPDGRLIAAGDSAGGICVYDIPSGRPMSCSWSPSYGSEASVPPFVASLSFCHGSTLLASACRNGTVALWDTSTASTNASASKTATDGQGEDSNSAVTPNAESTVSALNLVHNYGARYASFRSCLFTPENLLVCLALSTLCSEDDICA